MEETYPKSIGMGATLWGASIKLEYVAKISTGVVLGDVHLGYF